MKSTQEMTRPFLKAFSEIFNARVIRVRIIWCGSGESVLLTDERYMPEGAARIDTSLHTRQIPIFFDTQTVRGSEEGSGVHSGRFAQMGAESPPCRMSPGRGHRSTQHR